MITLCGLRCWNSCASLVSKHHCYGTWCCMLNQLHVNLVPWALEREYVVQSTNYWLPVIRKAVLRWSYIHTIYYYIQKLHYVIRQSVWHRIDATSFSVGSSELCKGSWLHMIELVHRCYNQAHTLQVSCAKLQTGRNGRRKITKQESLLILHPVDLKEHRAFKKNHDQSLMQLFKSHQHLVSIPRWRI